MAYARRTTVEVEKTQAELNRLLQRRSAANYGCGVFNNHATVQFTYENFRIRMTAPLPENAGKQQLRSIWRTLLEIVRFKFEAVEAGVRTFEQEFGFDTEGSDGRTVGEALLPYFEQARKGGEFRLGLKAGQEK